MQELGWGGVGVFFMETSRVWRASGKKKPARRPSLFFFSPQAERARETTKGARTLPRTHARLPLLVCPLRPRCRVRVGPPPPPSNTLLLQQQQKENAVERERLQVGRATRPSHRPPGPAAPARQAPPRRPQKRSRPGHPPPARRPYPPSPFSLPVRPAGCCRRGRARIAGRPAGAHLPARPHLWDGAGGGVG